MTSKELLDAARHGRNDIVKALLKKNVDVDSKGGLGWNALHWAAENGHHDVVKTLLENQATVDARTNGGATPLYFAALNGHNEVVQTLLENNASVDEADDFRWTPLHRACFYDHVHCVLTLLAAGADVHAKVTDDGKTAVHRAAWNKVMPIVPLLVALGADLDAVDQDGKSARQILADSGLQVDLSDGALERARRDILDFVRHRAMQVCIGLQSLRLDALQLCEILQFACGGALANLIAFHQWWAIATTVKHFRR